MSINQIFIVVARRVGANYIAFFMTPPFKGHLPSFFAVIYGLKS